MIKDLILKTFELKKKKGWDTLYWAVDIHETCIVPNYKAGEICTEFYPLAKEALQRISAREDSTLILFTCSYPHEIEKYLEYFKSHNIHFKFVNHNPAAENTAFGFFEKKFYCNMILDDKTGFVPAHWGEVMDALDIIDGIQSSERLKEAGLADYRGFVEHVWELEKKGLPVDRSDLLRLAKIYRTPVPTEKLT